MQILAEYALTKSASIARGSVTACTTAFSVISENVTRWIGVVFGTPGAFCKQPLCQASGSCQARKGGVR